MRLILLLLGLSVMALSQPAPATFGTFTGSTPSGSCANGPLQYNFATGLYGCLSGTWTQLNGGGGGVPGGTDTQVQFNDGGVFGGNSGFTFNKATGNVAVGNALLGSGTVSAPSYAFSAASDTGMWFENAGVASRGAKVVEINAAGVTVIEAFNGSNYTGVALRGADGGTCWTPGTLGPGGGSPLDTCILRAGAAATKSTDASGNIGEHQALLPGSKGETQPTCASALEGYGWYTKGSGVANGVYQICQNQSGSYSWVTH